jgi:hypothetical protein
MPGFLAFGQESRRRESLCRSIGRKATQTEAQERAGHEPLQGAHLVLTRVV